MTTCFYIVLQLDFCGCWFFLLFGLLSWNGIQVGKKWEESLVSYPFVPFLDHLA